MDRTPPPTRESHPSTVPRMKLLRRHFDTGFFCAQVLIDGIAVLAACLFGYWLFVPLAEGQNLVLANYGQLMVVITGITLVCFWACGMYKWNKSILNVEEYRSAFQAILLAFVVTTAVIFLLKGTNTDPASGANSWIYELLRPWHDALALDPKIADTSRLLFVIIFLAVFVVTVVQRSIQFRVSSWLHAKGYGNTNVAVYGSGRLALQVQQKLRLFPTLGHNFVGFVDADPALHGRGVRGFPVLGGPEQLEELCRRHELSLLIIADERLDEEQLVRLSRRCAACGLDYQVVPPLQHFFSHRFSVEKLDSIPLISVQNPSDSRFYHFAKRALDVAVASLVLVLAAPLMVLIAFLIKRESAGPIFFAQQRIGLNGRPFRIYKFRSMYVDMCRDEVTPQSSRDPRITRIGRYLRSSSLDELPQAWNVLRGDMSLVGPRPEMPFIVDTYSEVDRLRLQVKPGITGLWQVSEARKRPIHENLDYDLYYIDNQSIFLDLVILFLTASAVLRPRATF